MPSSIPEKRVGADAGAAARLDERSVTFKVKDYRIEGPGRYTTMTLEIGEFIRRFLIHVLPKGLMRIRHYGWMANRCRRQRAAQCRALLAVEPPPPVTNSDASARRCPSCGGAIEVVERIVPRYLSRRRPCRRREPDSS